MQDKLFMNAEEVANILGVSKAHAYKLIQRLNGDVYKRQVEQCANHCPTASYCALDSITVGTHEANPTMDQCTDCKSFQRKCC